MLDQLLRHRCTQRLEGLRLPQPLSAAALRDEITRLRQRRLYLHPIVPNTGMCGLWLETERADHIFVERRTSHAHQQHILAHELGHMLFEHSHPIVDESTLVLGSGRVSSASGEDVARTLLAGSNYSSEEEAEAEMVATLILESALRAPTDRRRAPTAFERGFGVAGYRR
ncbi:hypothetical protein [Allokutzneria albata]|uniref:IrrE N-terminal-like domain-containing protein n=1 Tax=Allokutzneria albata TaxID=211114 RepID=A0A1G9YBK0_ALLAB|nr:hypothetical protein [Allokutzneria albata]SDN06494.1 protein of unknown function [Allokutzneria albata]